jgi:DMSO/TMAO reductase YedYZ molybdopterin-dependent catalytic subunit
MRGVRGAGFWAGAAAGTVALLVAAVWRANGGPPSPPELVFDAIVASTPGRIEARAISGLRHLAKPLLLAVSSAALLIGAALAGLVAGAAGPRDASADAAGRWRWLRSLAWAFPFLAAQVAFAGSGSPARTDGILPGVLAQVVFACVLLLLRWEPRPSTDAGPAVSRRALLRRALLAGIGVIAGASAAALARGIILRSRRAPVDVAAVTPPSPPTGLFARPELATFVAEEVTPTIKFYRVSKNAIDPEVARAAWQLDVRGLVAQPQVLRLDDLERLPRVERYHTLMCISSEIGDGLIGNASWTGVRLMDVLDLARYDARTRFVHFRSADGYVESIPVDQARDTLLAYRMNGAPLEDRHGFPLRALVPGTYGMKNPKWITRIEAAEGPALGFWSRLGWNPSATPKTFSRIDVPRGRAIVKGDAVVAGIAYAWNRGITRVEISDDDGGTWRPAELRPALSPNAWTLWAVAWMPRRHGAQTLLVRATDGTGEVQTAEVKEPFPSGVSGYHRVPVTID